MLPPSLGEAPAANHQAHTHAVYGLDRKVPPPSHTEQQVNECLLFIEDPTSDVTIWTSNHSHLDIPRIYQHHRNCNFDMSRGVS
jgi:hypothetical protein